MLNSFLRPEQERHRVNMREMWFQQDGTTNHTARPSIEVVRQIFPGHVFSQFGGVSCPPSSPDLSICDFFLWDYLKSRLYVNKPNTIQDLKISIRQEIEAVSNEMLKRGSEFASDKDIILLTLFSEPNKRGPYHINHLRRKQYTHYGNSMVLLSQLPHSSATAAATVHEGYWTRFNKYLKNYCEMASLHGLRYCTESGRPFYERLFWIIAMIIVCFGMVITIKHQILYYLSNPILMSLNGNNVPVWDVPFPAITFCSNNQIPASVYNISHLVIRSKTENLTREEIQKLHLASLFCSNSNDKAVELYDNDNSLEDIFVDTFEMEVKTCKKTVKNLFWREKKEEKPCSLMQFSVMFSSPCHSFNMIPPLGFYSQTYIKNFISTIPIPILMNYPYKYMMNSSHWSPDNGYVKREGDPFDSIPFRLPGSNLAYSVNFLLDFEADNVQEYCKPKSYDFMVLVHNPSEKPSVHHFLTYAEVDRSTILRITPKLVETDPALHNWTPMERGCYYGHERKLMFFDIYTHNNCEEECEANVTRKMCNCNTIFQLHFSDTPICGKEKEKCFLDSLIASSSYDSNHRQALFSACDCLPACTELSYDVNVLSLPQNWTYNTESYGISPNETKQNTYANVMGFFNSRGVHSIVRVAVMSRSDFIANIGGVMGLFLGFSFISVFEMFYFSSIRWLTDLRKKIIATENVKNVED